MKPISFLSSSVRPIDDLLLLQPAKQTLRRAEHLKERRIYLDTPDWRLRNSDKWLYRRTDTALQHLICAGEGLEAQVASGTDAASNFLWQFPEELGTWLRSTVKMRRLAPSLLIELRIQVYRLEDNRHKTVSQLHFLRGRARLPGARRATPMKDRFVAIPLRGYDQAFQELVEQFEASHLFSRNEQSLYQCGLQLFQLNSPEPAPGLPTLEPGVSTTRAIQQVLEELRQRIVENADGLIAPLDTEYLHQFRVAIRKTRTLLGRGKGIFPKKSLQRFAGFFSWLGGSTGTARDLDVYLLKLAGYEGDWPNRFAEHLSELQEYLEKARLAQQKQLVAVLSSRRYRTGMRAWKEFLRQEPAARMPESLTRIEQFAGREVWRRYEKIRKKIKGLKPGGPSADLHRLRIQFKKLRYFLEFFSSLFEPSAEQIVSDVKKMQDTLGDFNDCTVQANWLDRLTEGFPGAENQDLRESISLLSQDLRRKSEALRREFEVCSKPFVRKKNTKRFRQLFRDQ